jgi:hypothetical protein
MDQKLFSVEVLESTYPGEQAEPLELVADVRGLTAEAAELLAALHGRGAWGDVFYEWSKHHSPPSMRLDRPSTT